MVAYRSSQAFRSVIERPKSRHFHPLIYTAARYSRTGSSIIKARIKPRGCRASQINLCRPFRKRGHGASFSAIPFNQPASSGFPIQRLAGHKQSRRGVRELQYDSWSTLPQRLPDASLILGAEPSASSALSQTRSESHRMLGLCVNHAMHAGLPSYLHCGSTSLKCKPLGCVNIDKNSSSICLCLSASSMQKRLLHTVFSSMCST